MGKPALWREMSALELRAAIALSRCSIVPGTFPKRFSKTLKIDTKAITDGQALVLWDLCWTFRRQISDPEVSANAKAVHEGGKAPLPQKDLPW